MCIWCSSLTLTFLFSPTLETHPEDKSFLDPFSLFGNILTFFFFFRFNDASSNFLSVVFCSRRIPSSESWKLDSRFGDSRVASWFVFHLDEMHRSKPIYRGSTWNNYRIIGARFTARFPIGFGEFRRVKRGGKEWKSRVQTECGVYAKRASRKKVGLIIQRGKANGRCAES